MNRRKPFEALASSNTRLENFSGSSSQREFSYLVDAMQPIDPDYTKKTFDEGERVKLMLREHLPAQYQVVFDFQGSVTSDTHIRAFSDIDLLALHGGFVSQDLGIPISNPYPGSVFQSLTSMRNDAASLLKLKYPAVDVNDAPGKAISLQGGSLLRKVDVVVGNWWDTELWKKYQVKMARGIQIIDTKVPELIRNKPFWHNYEIDKKDNKTGGLRKVIRLLKTLKYDSDPEVKISSYDIAALAWNMQESSLTVRADAYVQLATNARDELKRFLDYQAVRDALLVPNGTRKVFGIGGAAIEGLRGLHRELADLLEKVNQELLISFSRYYHSTNNPNLPSWVEQRPRVIVENSY
jgi:hypothetical protein